MTRLAAIDVGSNSIRHVIASVDRHGTISRLHVERTVARLGSSVFRTGRLSDRAMADAFDALTRMDIANCVHGVSSLRAVGTSALRDARNRSAFVRHASAILGAPLNVIDGPEEARLVHAAASREWPHPHECVLIGDLGGGSLELIVSDRGTLVDAVSLPLGAVRLTEAFLDADPPRATSLARMSAHVRSVLATEGGRLARWRSARLIATSGTARAIVTAVSGLDQSRREDANGLGATAAEVVRLYSTLMNLDTRHRARITGAGRKRAEVLVAGVAVFAEVLTTFGLPALSYSSAGLSEGIIADLAARRSLAGAPSGVTGLDRTSVPDPLPGVLVG
jgi:exopolyphosphatase/guanosine-5'-triphosphate,3'-diphosphate pyrophosphatase